MNKIIGIFLFAIGIAIMLSVILAVGICYKEQQAQKKDICEYLTGQMHDGGCIILQGEEYKYYRTLDELRYIKFIVDNF